jgi:hypothetical protein
LRPCMWGTHRIGTQQGEGPAPISKASYPAPAPLWREGMKRIPVHTAPDTLSLLSAHSTRVTYNSPEFHCCGQGKTCSPPAAHPPHSGPGSSITAPPRLSSGSWRRKEDPRRWGRLSSAQLRVGLPQR